VPAHRDWHPCNWIWNGEHLAVIDCEHAHPGPWHDDLHRLWWQEWHDRPDLFAAFRRGYGDFAAEELVAMRDGAVIGQMISIVWADEHADQEFAGRARARLREAIAAA